MEAVFGIVILIFSIVIHEVAHGYTADRLGDPTARYAGRLTLNPLPHLDLMGSIILPVLTYFGGGFIFGWAKPVPYDPRNIDARWGEAAVAFAGPLSNILLALVFGLLLQGGVIPLTAVPIVEYIVLINIVLAVFNLVPIPPLDGSKLLFAFLPASAMNIRYTLERYGLVLVLVFVFFAWGIIAPIVEYLFRLFIGA